MRPPDIHVDARDRAKRVAQLHKTVQRFKAIPPDRREDEHADIGEVTCRALLKELGVIGD